MVMADVTKEALEAALDPLLKCEVLAWENQREACQKAIALALDAFAQQIGEARERELLRKLEALQMRLATEAQQARDKALLEERERWFRATLSQGDEAWSREAYDTATMICERALKSAASAGGGE